MYKIEKKKLKDVPAGHWVRVASEYILKNCGEHVKCFVSGTGKSDSVDCSEVLDFGPADPKAMPGNYIEAKDGSIWKVYIAGLGEQPEVGMVGVAQSIISCLYEEINEIVLDKELLVSIGNSGLFVINDSDTAWTFFATCVYTPEPAENPKLIAMKAELDKMKSNIAELERQIKELE